MISKQGNGKFKNEVMFYLLTIPSEWRTTNIRNCKEMSYPPPKKFLSFNCHHE